MEPAEKKTERLMQLEQILLSRPQGLRRAEIARRLNVHRSTVGRYIDELSRQIAIWEDDKQFVGIERDSYLNNIRLTMHESMALYLASRLMADRMDRHNPHAGSALRKLGQSLKDFAPWISSYIISTADIMDSPNQVQDPQYIKVMEILTHSWSEGRWVRIHHYSIKKDREYMYDFAPYFIEPYAVGQTAHTIGRCKGSLETLPA